MRNEYLFNHQLEIGTSGRNDCEQAKPRSPKSTRIEKKQNEKYFQNVSIMDNTPIAFGANNALNSNMNTESTPKNARNQFISIVQKC